MRSIKFKRKMNVKNLLMGTVFSTILFGGPLIGPFVISNASSIEVSSENPVEREEESDVYEEFEDIKEEAIWEELRSKGLECNRENLFEHDEEGNNILMAYLINGGKDLNVINWILDQGIDVNAKNSIGHYQTALVLAVKNFSGKDVVSLLLERGANPDICVSRWGKHLLQEALSEESPKIDLEVLDLLLEKILEIKPEFRKMFLWDCVSVNNKIGIKVVKLLIKHGIDMLTSGNFATPISCLCANGQVDEEILKKFEEEGADFNEKNHLGFNSLMLAAMLCRNIDVIKYLLERCDIDEIGENGETCLMCAAQNSYIKYNVVELILQKYEENHFFISSYVKCKDLYGNTALIFALDSRGQSLETIKLLIKYGANLEDRDRFGNTVLMLAAEIGSTDILRLFLRESILVSSINNQDIQGMTALMLAAANGHISCVNLLLNVEGIALNLTSEKGLTALDYAVTSRSSSYYLVNMMMEKGAESGNIFISAILNNFPQISTVFSGENCMAELDLLSAKIVNLLNIAAKMRNFEYFRFIVMNNISQFDCDSMCCAIIGGDEEIIQIVEENKDYRFFLNNCLDSAIAAIKRSREQGNIIWDDIDNFHYFKIINWLMDIKKVDISNYSVDKQILINDILRFFNS